MLLLCSFMVVRLAVDSRFEQLKSSELNDGGAIYQYGERLRAWNHAGARLRAVVEDINGDGQAEILLPGPRLVSATNGATLWDLGQDLLSEELLLQRYLVCPDIDGDGVKDIATARLNYISHTVGAKLIVSAISGETGEIIWTQQRSLHEVLEARPDAAPMGAPLWGPYAADGMPTLLIPCRIKPRGATHHSIIVYGFSLRLGELVHEIKDIADPRTADFDGDGLADLFWFTPHPASGKYLPSGALHAISGRSPVIWQRPEILKPVGDLNADGSIDVARLSDRRRGNAIYPGPVTAVCGKTGRKLWQSKRDFSEILAGQFVSSNCSSDAGAADIKMLLGRGVYKKQLRVAALSNNEGAELWMATNLGPKTSSAAVQIDEVRYTDLDRDGQTEVIIGFFSGKRDIGTTVINTTDGRTLWSDVWTPPGSDVRTNAAQVVGIARFDDDAVDDLLFLHCQEGLRQYRACSGIDGRLLWERTFPDRVLHELFTHLNPVADLNGDGKAEVLVIDDQVLALDGETGEPRWSYTWPDREQSKVGEGRAGENTVPIYDVSGIPTLADLRGDDTSSICFIAHNHLVILDGGGQPHQRTMLEGHSPRDELSPGRVWALDANDDGADELIFVRAIPPAGYSRHWESDEQIYCYSNGGQDLLWKWSMPAGFGQIMQTLPATEARPATVVLLSGSSVFGISAVTGKPIWRCDGEQWWGSAAGRPERYRYYRFGPRLIEASNNGYPTILFRQYQSDGMPMGTACRQALPTNETGRYASP